MMPGSVELTMLSAVGVDGKRSSGCDGGNKKLGVHGGAPNTMSAYSQGTDSDLKQLASTARLRGRPSRRLAAKHDAMNAV